MLNLSNLKPKVRRKLRKRVGRGTSSGHGAYSGRGIKGQKARTGGNIRPGFEGGRMPLVRQFPKVRGFRSIHKKPQVVNLGTIELVYKPNEIVTRASLRQKGLVDSISQPVKILGGGNLTKKLDFQGVAISGKAKDLIAKAGGQIIPEKDSPQDV